MKENYLRTKIKKALVAEGGFWVVIHQSGYMQKGLSDIVGFPSDGPHAGIFHSIEVKLPNKLNTLTDLQRHTLETIRDAGGRAEVITNVNDALSFVYDPTDAPKRRKRSRKVVDKGSEE